MPRRKLNNRLKRNNAQRNKKFFRATGNTNKKYHSKIPRTLQIATRRNNSQMLRFVKNLTYEINPQTLVENIYLQIRANSIYDIMVNDGSQNQPSTWQAQDPAYSPGAGVVNADGYNDWHERFQQFCVLGSKIQVTFQPSQAAHDAQGRSVIAPTTAYITLSGALNQIGPLTAMKDIVKLPYMKRAQIMGNNVDSSGIRLHQFYSAKRFEGVKDVLDNNQLKGHFSNDSSNPAQPNEKSYYNIGLVPTTATSLGGTGHRPQPQGIFRVKVEYIVKLTEPTNTNQVSA
jgi:hypothetical protein